MLIAFWLITLEPEQVYQGQPLSFWLREFETKPGGREYLNATQALTHFSPLAAPYLARLLNRHESKLLAAIREKLPNRIGQILTPKLDPMVIRFRSFLLLKQLGPNARQAIPELTRLLRSHSDETRRRAAEVLGSIGPDAKPAVPALVELLKSGDKGDRAVATRALGAIGLAAREAIPPLLSAMGAKQIDWAFTVPVLIHLGHLPVEAVPLIIDDLGINTNSLRRINAATCLGMIGHDASPVVPALIDALQDPDSRVRAKVATALASIGPGASIAVPALTEMMKDEWWYVRENAATALGKIGSASKPAIPALVILKQHDPNQDVRNAATEAITVIQRDSIAPTTR